MGVLLNEVCCIDESNITETLYEQTQPTQPDTVNKSNKFKALRRRSINELKDSFPLNEIGSSFNINDKPIKPIHSLSKIPISTKNVILQQMGNPLDYYDNLKKMGKGTFGTVYKVMHKQSGAIRAMKVISKKKLKYGFTDEDILQEINVLTKLEHPHIIRIFEFYNYNKNYYIINEFCNEGDLSDKLNKIKKFPEFFVKILMVQIFNAVLYLHKKCVFHGDLKLENIMIDSFLSNDEPVPTKKNQDNFISSLLEDEKEIDEYLKEKEIRRSNTLVPKSKKNLNLRSSFNLKSKDNNKLKLSNSGFKKVSTISNSCFFKSKKTPKDNIFNIKGSSTFYKAKKEKKEKNPFSYLNGEVDEEEENEDEKKESPEENVFDYLNGVSDEKKMNNIKVFNEDVYDKNELNEFYHKKKHYLEIINEKDDLNIPTEDSFIDEDSNDNNNNNHNNNHNNNAQLKKTLTLNSMKLKNFELKLIDFGCAKIFSKYKTNFGEIIGTLIYCSPEVLKNNYSKECDIWSCGVIMYALLSGHFPFYGKSEEDIKKKILSGKFDFNPKYFSGVSDKAKDLIKKCLVYDKYKRISAEDALKHEFFMDDINPNNIFEDEIDTKNILLSLKNYSNHSKIYQTVLTYLSHNFSDKEELNKLKKIFYKIDLNLDGKLSKSEFEQAFKEAGIDMNKEQIETMMKSIDFDGNGFIEYEEFIRVALPKEKLFTEKNLKIAFDMFDLDKNGTISLDEFKTILGIKKIDDIKVDQELLNEIPIKENEEMTFEQFKLLFLKENQVIS